jgi:HAD superfamily hydrolase (TIGR01509 family)
MITTLLFDFSRVLIHPKDNLYSGGMNELHNELNAKYIPYEFSDYFVINQEMLDFLKTIKSKINLAIFTKETLQNRPEIRVKIDPVFDNIFSAKELNLSKKDPHSYLFVCKKLKVEPRNVLFIDDTVKNIEAAEEAGLDTIHYISNSQVIEHIVNVLQAEREVLGR